MGLQSERAGYQTQQPLTSARGNKPLSQAQLALKKQQEELKKKLDMLEQDKKKMQETINNNLKKKVQDQLSGAVSPKSQEQGETLVQKFEDPPQV